MIALLLNHLWQSSLFLGAAGLMTLALRRNSAHVRFWLWFAASIKFLVPFAALTALGATLLTRRREFDGNGRIHMPCHGFAQQCANPRPSGKPADGEDQDTGCP